MKKRTKKQAKTRRVALKALRVHVIEEHISPPMDDGPADLRMELENVLNNARKTLACFGEQPIILIVYSADKRLLLEPDLRDYADKILTKAVVKDWSEKHRARAAIFAGEGWIRPPGSISREDPRREEALIAAAKNRREHFVALQRYHRLANGQFFFEKPEIIDLHNDCSEYEDTWLCHLQF